MALNVKVALVVCVVFIGGMCWVIDMVARPVLAMPAPAVVDAAADEGDRYLRPVDFSNPDDRLAYESPVAQRVVPSATAGLPEFTPPTRYSAGLPPMIASLESDPATASALAVQGDPAVHEPPLRRAVPVAKLPADAELLDVEAVLTDPDRGQVPEMVIASAVLPQDEIAAADPIEPAAEADRPVAALTGLPQHSPAETREYTIQKNDTLASIALRFWGKNNANALAILQACNPELRDANLIVIGDRLLIPPFEVAKAMRDERLQEASQQVATVASDTRLAQRMYTVRESDTLTKIAAKELNDARRWVEIARLNKMKDANQIRPGTTLLLPEVGSDT